MTAGPGQEFNIIATPTQALQRKLAYLATQDSDSVLTGGLKSVRAAFGSASRNRAAENGQMLLQMARLSDPAYQLASAQINADLDRMDEASVYALQAIEHELLALRRERERMLEHAYRDEDGNAIFMADDKSGAFYADGSQVEDDKLGEIRDQLQGGPTWEAWEGFNDRQRALSAERDQIHAFQARGDELRNDLAEGSISKEEATLRAKEIEEAQPDRVRRSYRTLGSSPEDINAEAVDPADAQAAQLTAGQAPDHDDSTVVPAPRALPFQPG